MNTNDNTETRSHVIEKLTKQTVSALKKAQGNSSALEAAIQDFLNSAIVAKLKTDDIEDILGVNEPSIMDLASLSEGDEEIVIDAFERFLDNQST